jgi:hypothetical protein
MMIVWVVYGRSCVKRELANSRPRRQPTVAPVDVGNSGDGTGLNMC